VLVLMLGCSLKNIDTLKISFAVGGGALRTFGGLLLSTSFVLLKIDRTRLL
jgi:hypothetical protein